MASDFFRQLAAQFDIDTTTRHIGGNGHRAKRACAGDDLAFFGVLARVQAPGAERPPCRSAVSRSADSCGQVQDLASSVAAGLLRLRG